jgi:translation initiation factor IF-3
LETKEIRMRLSIEPHDLEVKKSKIKDFLAKGHKVRITVILKGREMAFLNRGYEFLERFEKSLGESIQREKEAERLGKRISIILVKKS